MEFLMAEIRKIFNKSLQVCGSPRIAVELAGKDHRVSRAYVTKLMKEMGLRAS